MDPPGQTNETNATNGYPPGRYFRGNLHHSVRCKMIRNNDQLEMRDNRRIIRSRFGIIAYVYCGMSGPFSWRTRLEKKKKKMERIAICSELSCGNEPSITNIKQLK